MSIPADLSVTWPKGPGLGVRLNWHLPLQCSAPGQKKARVYPATEEKLPDLKYAILLESAYWPLCQSFLTISYALAAKPTRVIAVVDAIAKINISNPITVIFSFPAQILHSEKLRRICFSSSQNRFHGWTKQALVSQPDQWFRRLIDLDTCS